MTTSLTAAPASDLLSSTEALDRAWKLAELFAQSELIPAHLRKKPHDVFVALAMASQLGVNPLIVLQSIYVIGGRAGFAASFTIAMANASKRFRGPIRWKSKGEPGDADFAVTAYATIEATGDEVDATVSMEMARAENWTRNAKYRTMPEHMLRMRSATWLIRLYAPEVLLGLHTADEIEDVEASRIRVEPERVAQVVEDEAAASRTRRAPKPKVIDATPTAEHLGIVDEVAVERANREPAAEPEVVEAVEPTPAPEPEPPKRQHHPSWEADRPNYWRLLGENGRDKDVAYEAITRASATGQAPSEMDPLNRAKALRWLLSSAGQQAYAALLAERQAAAEVQP